jgi:hypothetical protein
MYGLKHVAALAALTAATGAHAANFLEYTFTGHGSGVTSYYSTQTGIEETYIPLGSFSVNLYVSLDTGSNCEGGGGSSGGCYEGNGVDRYFILGPAISELNNISFSGNSLLASDTRSYFSDSVLQISADFLGSPKGFADLGSTAKFSSGGFSYSEIGRRYSAQFSGEITGFSVRSANGPGEVNVFFSAIPEPATWAMMLAGFGVVGIGLRRRRKPVPSVDCS